MTNEYDNYQIIIHFGAYCVNPLKPSDDYTRQ